MSIAELYSESLNSVNSESHISKFSVLLSNVRMKTNDEIRRQNLELAIKKAGSAARLADAAKTSAAYLSQIKNRTPDSKSGTPKMMGDDMARRIEAAVGEPHGWMDTPHTAPEQPPAALGSDQESPFIADAGEIRGSRPVRADEVPDTVSVPRVKLRLRAGVAQFDTEPDMGNDGFEEVPRSVLIQLHLEPYDLIALRVRGNSMEPMMFEDDIVVVDKSDRKPINREIYAVNFDGEALVKQLLYRAGQWYMHSVNPDYGPVNVRSGQCSIVGRVVYQPGRVVTGRL